MSLTVNPALVRNGLRYAAGALVAKGMIDANTGAALVADQAVVDALTSLAGLVLGAATEAVYALAKRMGWRT